MFLAGVRNDFLKTKNQILDVLPNDINSYVLYVKTHTITVNESNKTRLNRRYRPTECATNLVQTEVKRDAVPV